MRRHKKIGIFKHEDLETGTRNYSAPGADMDRRVVVDVFFVVTNGGLRKSAIYTVVNAISYVFIIYGNILFLYPVFYQKRKFVSYGISVAFFLI